MKGNKMKVVVEEWAYMPNRAHAADAGMDLFSPFRTMIPANSSVAIDTGVHVQIPAGYVGFIKSKSGLMVKQGFTTEGVIDSGYTGSIVVKVFNHSPSAWIIEKGQKITQLVILPVLLPEIEVVDSLEDTERGTDGFGSTGDFL